VALDAILTGAYKYYITRLGRTVAATALRLRQEVVVPALTQGCPSTC